MKPDDTVSQATYGDTGARFMGSLGAGFRLQLGERFAFRLEVRDVVYTARMERVNGCNVDDLRAMDMKIRSGQDPATATVGADLQRRHLHRHHRGHRHQAQQRRPAGAQPGPHPQLRRAQQHRSLPRDLVPLLRAHHEAHALLRHHAPRRRLASAQDLAVYNKALSAYNGNQFEDSARLFFEVTNTTTDNDLRLKAEYYLASSFQRSNLPFTAFVYFTPIVKAGPQHPYHLKSVEALIALQEVLNDDFLIPSIMNNLYDRYADAWATLPLEVLARINYLIGRIAHREGKLDEAKQFLEAVPDTSQFYAKAQYLMGITLADPRFPAADEQTRIAQRSRRPSATFENVLKMRTRQLDFDDTKHLALPRAGPHQLQLRASTRRRPSGTRRCRASASTGTSRCSRTASPASRTTTSAARSARCRASTRRSSPAPSSPSRGSSPRPPITSRACTTSRSRR